MSHEDVDIRVELRPQEVRLRDVRRLRLEPGDVIVLTLPTGVPVEAVRETQRQAAEFFPDNKVLVKTEGTELAVIGQPLAPREEASTG